MRELTKSIASYAWANSLFGIQQLLSMLNREQEDPKQAVTAAFDTVSATATAQLNPSLKAAFDSAEGFQRSMVNTLFEIVDPERWMTMGNRIVDQTAMGARRAEQAGSEAMRQTATPATGTAGDAARHATTGFGPMPR